MSGGIRTYIDRCDYAHMIRDNLDDLNNPYVIFKDSDDDCLVYADCRAYQEHLPMSLGKKRRKKIETEGSIAISKYKPEGSFNSLRFDTMDFLMISESMATLRHHKNALGEM